MTCSIEISQTGRSGPHFDTTVRPASQQPDSAEHQTPPDPLLLPASSTMASTDAHAPPKGPYRLVTVNNAPERAKLLIGRVASDLADRYTIDYVGNCASEPPSNRAIQYPPYA